MTDDQIAQLLVLDAQPGPALPLDPAAADALVEAALVGAGFGPAGGPGSTGGSSAPSGGAGTRGVVGTKLVIGTIALAVVVFVIAFLVGRHSAHHIAAAPPDAAPDAALLAGTGAPSPDAAAIAKPEIAVATPDAEIAMEPAPARRTSPPAEPRAVNDLLGEANAKRAAHQWRESDALYARVVKRVPGTPAAQTALVASASLHLEHLGDPRGAAERFRRALAIDPNGAMAEEARWGITEAARARHDAAAEAAALDEFLAHYPDSPLAAGARARRQELK